MLHKRGIIAHLRHIPQLKNGKNIIAPPPGNIIKAVIAVIAAKVIGANAVVGIFNPFADSGAFMRRNAALLQPRSEFG